MAKQKQTRAIHLEVFVETTMNDAELQEAARETSNKLAKDCQGRFVIAIGVIRPDDAATLWNVANQVRGTHVKPG